MDKLITKWETLAGFLQKEEAIMGGRNTAERLEQLYDNGLAVIKENGVGELVVFGGLWETPVEGFVEAGSFWVHPKYRGKGLASWMFKFLSEKIPVDQVGVCITHNDKVVHLLLQAGWQEVTAEEWEVVVPWEVSCEPCEELGEDEKPTCPFKAVKSSCRMFYKRGQVKRTIEI